MVAQPDEAFRLLVESVKDYAIFMLDPKGYVMTWNEGAQRIKGYTADEIIGKHFSVFYSPEDVARGVCEEELEAATRKGRFEVNGWRYRKDGTALWATVVITALFGESGELRGFAKVTRDFTKLREAEEASRRLDEMRLRHQQALEVNDDIIQGLAVADLALNLDDYDKARDAIRSTLDAARKFVTDLLGEGRDTLPIEPGDLRKRERDPSD